MPNINYQFHTSTLDAWQAMLDSCNQASSSIYIEEYILNPDQIGLKFVEAIKNKASENIHIKLLLDWWGSRSLYNSSLPEELTKLGVDVRFYRSPRLNWLKNPKNFFPRDHRKLVIVDEKTAFIGGVCVADHMYSWRDTMVEIEGGPVDQMICFFNELWQQADTSSNQEVNNRLNNGGDLFNVFANKAYDNKNNLYDHVLDKISMATNSIKLVTPYFTPTLVFMDALLNAIHSGVKLELMLSNYSKYSPYVVGKYQIRDLLDAGANIYYYQPCMLHLKTIIIDSAWSAIGSLNLDGLSFLRNEELMLTSEDVRFTDTLIQHFMEDKKAAALFTMDDWNAVPLTQKIIGRLLYPLRRYL